MDKTSLLEKVNSLPNVPGIYIFKDHKGVLYVGKAKNLKNRVKSYFQDNLLDGTKTKSLVSKIEDLEHIESLSELEAFILEAELIKKYRPKYNISLKDDKSYLYIVIRNDEFVIDGRRVSIPKIITARETDLQKKDIIFGPYPESNTAKFIVRAIRRALPYRDCSFSKFNRYKRLGQPCLYGHLGLCQAPCTGAISIQEYKKEILRIKKFLSGNSSEPVKSIKKSMKEASEKQDFETAAKYRDELRKFEYIRQTFKTPQTYIENPYFVEDLLNQALDELVINIPILKKLPQRIECYDISNFSGKEATGSMVVAIKGRIQKSEYRKFRIKFKNEPDDFGMIREVLRRRLKRELFDSPEMKKWGMPDLIVIDGGKGQVSAANEVMQESNIEIPVIGLAKKFETIVYQSDGIFKEINLGRSSEGLKLLQRLRDEAHRFARKYHHLLRLKKLGVIKY